jgi:hypothetical protein
MRTRSARYPVAVAAMTALGLVACSGDEPTDAGSAPLRSTSTTEAPEPAGGEATTTEPPAPGTGPAGEGRNGGTVDPSPPAMPFVADTRPDTSPPAQGFSILVSLTKGEHPGYVRYVFDFEDHSPEGLRGAPARPAWDVRYVPRSEVVQDGSGFPVSVEGDAVLRITFEGAAMHWEDGSDSLRQPVDAYDRLRLGGDFEGYVTWFLGLDEERPFRAFWADGKVVVDVVAR